MDFRIEKVSAILSMLDDYMGNIQLSTDNLKSALNLAISQMSQQLRVPYFVPVEFQQGVSSYDTTDMHLSGGLVVQVARVDDTVFDDVAWWSYNNNRLQVSPSLAGPGRVISLAEPPRVSSSTLTLAEHVDIPATEIWLNGRVNELQNAGWVAIGDDVFFYRGLTYMSPPDRTFTSLEQALVDAGADAELFSPVYDIVLGSGTYTKLSNVSLWPTSYSFTAHNIGEVVEPCIGYVSGETLNKLVTAAAINAYRVKINSCAQPEDKQLYSQLMRNAQEELGRTFSAVQPVATSVIKRRNPFIDFRRSAGRVYRG